jgi:hypothetical protein
MGPVVLVFGAMGRTPFAGMAWQILHYLEGLRRLGCDAWYVEDTGDWPYDPVRNAITDDPTYTVEYLDRALEWAGFKGRWAYRSSPKAGVFGMSEAELGGLLERADALVNVTGATILREEHLRVPVRIYLETDPVLPQIEVDQGNEFTIELLEAHTHHFTFGENLGNPDCRVPVGRFDYRPTRQPVVLDWWRPSGAPTAEPRFTTVASWRQRAKDVEWNGETYTWSKHTEFLRMLDLPARTGASVEVALPLGAGVDPETDAEIEQARTRGWRFVDSMAISARLEPYRDYVLASDAEFSVAKDQNIRLRSGWFSDRSATYLAAGKPVVTQDTGFGNILPTGLGLLTFRTLEEAVVAVEDVRGEYEKHRRAAKEIAEAHFDAARVLGPVLDASGLR